MTNMEKYYTARLRVHTAALTKIQSFGNITPYRLVNVKALQSSWMSPSSEQYENSASCR